MMKLKPAEGRAVRDPDTMALLPAEGRNVPDTMFWRRRLRDGDVVEVGADPAPRAMHHRAAPAAETKES
jgi:hypothetical protein